MDKETPFRLALLGVAFLQASVSSLYVKKSGAASTICRRHEEGIFMTVPLVLCYLGYCVGVVIYLIVPEWMMWSAVPTPAWIRWLGLIVLLLGGALIVWGLHALGNNLTFVPATKENHTLVTSGPYGWVRHPLYTAFFVEVVGVGLLVANWFVACTGLLTWVLLAIRTKKEEQKLIERFGEAYRDYMTQVGQFLPRL